jgi:hypothetical protein
MDTQDEIKEFAQAFKKRVARYNGSLGEAAKVLGMTFRQSLFNKLAKGTLRSLEERKIAKYYGCEVVWREGEKRFLKEMAPKIKQLQGLYLTYLDQVRIMDRKKTPDNLKALLETYGHMMHLLGELQGHYETFYGEDAPEKLQELQAVLPFIPKLSMEELVCLSAMKICTVTL